jgi:molybdate transport system substrate-binding protein
MRVLRAFIAVVLGLAMAGCGGASGGVTLTVFAASSLTESFGEIARVYERAHPGVRLRLTFSGSTDLVERLRERQPGDVLVTADRPSLDAAAKYAGEPVVAVASNSMTIAVAPGNPKRIRGPADLRRPGLRVALGAPMVPVGRYAHQVLAKSGGRIRPGSEEISSRMVLTRVRTGEADAGIVYITDLRAAGAAASSVPIPAEQNVTADYLAAPVAKSPHHEAATAFVSWLAGPACQQVLRRHGFLPPR